MTQTRNDFQVKATLAGVDLCEQYPSDRQSITVLKNEILCTTKEVRDTCNDLLSARDALRKIQTLVKECFEPWNDDPWYLLREIEAILNNEGIL